jgi:hypothetical protein
MVHGARICPRCRMRVDERRARGALHCLSCGAPLGMPPPFATNRSGGSSTVVWIVVGVVVLLLASGVAVGGAVWFIAQRDASDDPVKKASSNTAAPLESVATATATAPPPSAPRPPHVVLHHPPFGGVPTAPTATSPTAPTTPTATTPTGALPEFPRERALAELDRVTAGLQSCSRTGDPTGKGTVRVDFEPDGRVGTLMRPPFGPTATGSCISSRFLAIRIGRFAGSTQHVERTFTIAPGGRDPGF